MVVVRLKSLAASLPIAVLYSKLYHDCSPLSLSLSTCWFRAREEKGIGRRREGEGKEKGTFDSFDSLRGPKGETE